MTFDSTKHRLVPLHQKLNEAEARKLVQHYATDVHSFPKIFRSDPAIAKLSIKEGDIVRIERTSKTAGTVFYYRMVVHG